MTGSGVTRHLGDLIMADRDPPDERGPLERNGAATLLPLARYRTAHSLKAVMAITGQEVHRCWDRRMGHIEKYLSDRPRLVRPQVVQ
jgi:hypothetical protein